MKFHSLKKSTSAVEGVGQEFHVSFSMNFHCRLEIKLYVVYKCQSMEKLYHLFKVFLNFTMIKTSEFHNIKSFKTIIVNSVFMLLKANNHKSCWNLGKHI